MPAGDHRFEQTDSCWLAGQLVVAGRLVVLRIPAYPAVRDLEQANS